MAAREGGKEIRPVVNGPSRRGIYEFVLHACRFKERERREMIPGISYPVFSRVVPLFCKCANELSIKCWGAEIDRQERRTRAIFPLSFGIFTGLWVHACPVRNLQPHPKPLGFFGGVRVSPRRRQAWFAYPKLPPTNHPHVLSL
ncbi:hypothetical protein EJ04DRAFT_97358 [Polyplosphaeria fusca]|uniref:Uncharacterized protein n=1 Tax=Polyplosphaeria fusca TaxID=682080 RepID=A0A9P4UU30_9PLEO|nr:hypothetical protein EJ04DRAFT_97358 [Polyplosphaeria fusca]